MNTFFIKQAVTVGMFAAVVCVVAPDAQAFTFERDLKQGMSGQDVKELQILLNSDPDTQLAESGPGAPGEETTYFGPLTNAAFEKYLQKVSTETDDSVSLQTEDEVLAVTDDEDLTAAESYYMNVDTKPVCRSITAKPSTIVAGGKSTLTWVSTGATTATIQRDLTAVVPVSANRSMEVSPDKTATFALKLSNSRGSVGCSVTVQVTAAPAVTPVSGNSSGKSDGNPVTPSTGKLPTFIPKVVSPVAPTTKVQTPVVSRPVVVPLAHPVSTPTKPDVTNRDRQSSVAPTTVKSTGATPLAHPVSTPTKPDVTNRDRQSSTVNSYPTKPDVTNRDRQSSVAPTTVKSTGATSLAHPVSTPTKPDVTNRDRQAPAPTKTTATTVKTTASVSTLNQLSNNRDRQATSPTKTTTTSTSNNRDRQAATPTKTTTTTTNNRDRQATTPSKTTSSKSSSPSKTSSSQNSVRTGPQ